MLASSNLNRRYGYLRDRGDARDLAFFSPAVRGADLIDLERWCGAKKDQGQQGSCTAHAGSEAAEWLVRRFPTQVPALRSRNLDPATIDFSPAYLYYAERLFDGDVTADAGSTGRSSCRVMNGKSSDVKMGGLCLSATMPYDEFRFTTPPTQAAIDEAHAFQLGAYHRIDGRGGAIACLASGYPFLLGMAVYQSFESDGVTRTGLVPMPNVSAESMLGGHEVLVIGHNAGAREGAWPADHFKVRNSWGAHWGDAGNFYLPDMFIDDPRLAWDMWMIHLGPAWK